MNSYDESQCTVIFHCLKAGTRTREAGCKYQRKLKGSKGMKQNERARQNERAKQNGHSIVGE